MTPANPFKRAAQQDAANKLAAAIRFTTPDLTPDDIDKVIRDPATQRDAEAAARAVLGLRGTKPRSPATWDMVGDNLRAHLTPGGTP